MRSSAGKRPSHHGRRSVRLNGYDYAAAGAYFFTIAVQGKMCLFGKVVDGEIRETDAGMMVERWWLEIENKFPNVAVDECMVTPNHFHGIVIITDDLVGGNGHADGSTLEQGAQAASGAHAGAPLQCVYSTPIRPAHTNRTR